MIVIAVAERAHVPTMSAAAEERYARGWASRQRVAAMVAPAATRSRWLALLAGTKVTAVYNLLPPARKAGAWDPQAASTYALLMLTWAAQQQGQHGADEPARLILLGRKVERAFYGNNKRTPAAWGRAFDLWCGAGPVKCMVVPHPSGRNRAYNDYEVRARVQWALHRFCAEVK